MKWDEGLLTLILITGATIAGSVACGPTSNQIKFLTPSRAHQAQDMCLQKIGTGRQAMIGVEKDLIGVPLCTVREGSAGVFKYALETVAAAYSIAPEDGHLAVTVRFGVDVIARKLGQSASGNDSALVASALKKTCGERISHLWGKGARSALNVEFESVGSDDSKDVHLLRLLGTANSGEGLALSNLANRERFYMPGEIRGEDEKACDAMFPEEEQAAQRADCYTKQARDVTLQSNDRFCANLAVLTAHMLGLSTPEERAGTCAAPVVAPAQALAANKEEAAPGPKASPSKPVEKTFFELVSDPKSVGADFWVNVHFTEMERREILARGCGEKIVSTPNPNAPSPVVIKPAKRARGQVIPQRQVQRR